MPIEIRELVIRVQVLDSSVKNLQTQKRTLNEKEIIERCVERILRKLNKKAER